jgi:hypothetical protein
MTLKLLTRSPDGGTTNRGVMLSARLAKFLLDEVSTQKVLTS